MIILVLVQIDAKQVQKRSTTPGEIPTLGESDDHTDGTWLDTDVYDGEFFANLADGKLFIMLGGEVYEFGVKKQTFVVAGGGQDTFVLPKNILSDVVLLEDGIPTTRVITQTEVNEIETDSLIPEGTEVLIIY